MSHSGLRSPLLALLTWDPALSRNTSNLAPASNCLPGTGNECTWSIGLQHCVAAMLWNLDGSDQAGHGNGESAAPRRGYDGANPVPKNTAQLSSRSELALTHFKTCPLNPTREAEGQINACQWESWQTGKASGREPRDAGSKNIGSCSLGLVSRSLAKQAQELACVVVLQQESRIQVDL